MREILFRGKRKDNGEWVYGWLGHLHCHNPQAKTINSIYFTEITEDHNDKLNIIVDYKTVGQYTGLTDKNDTKIFEGDIVKYTQFEKFYCKDELKEAEEKSEFINVVSFDEGTFSPLPTRYDCEDYWYSFAVDDFEVIGNIHDNPELLKGDTNNA